MSEAGSEGAGDPHWSRSPTLALAAGAASFVGELGLVLVMLPGSGVLRWIGVVLLTSLGPLAVPAGLSGVVVGVRALRADAGDGRRAAAGIVLGLLGLGLWLLGLSLSNLSNLSNLSRLQNL